jgi:hypothetical protein
MASIKDVEAGFAQQENAIPITIHQLDGEPYRALDGTPATISVVGEESKRVRAYEEQRRERVRRGLSAFGAEAEHEARVDRAVAAVVDWHGWDDGENPIECTPANVRALLAAPAADHVLRQVERGMGAHGVFSRASSGD